MMTDAAISLADFADTFEAKTNSLDIPDCHPATSHRIWELMADMRHAAEREHAAEVARIAGLIARKVAQDRQWNAEDEASIAALRGRRQ